MPHRSCRAVLLLFATSLPAQAPAPAPAGAADWTACRFDWGVPCTVLVVRDGGRQGARAKLRYRVALERSGRDGELVLQQSDVEFLQVRGRDATTPAARKALAPALAIAEAVPDTIVDRRGNFLRVDGLDATVERLVAVMAERKDQTPEQQERLLRGLRTEEARAMMQQACGDDWQTWVGAWVEFDLEPGSEETGEIQIPFRGAGLPAQATARNHGPAAGHPGCFKLSLTTVVQGPAAAAAIGESMARLAEQAGGKPLPADAVEDLRVVTEVVAITDPRNLRTRWASRTKTIRLSLKGHGAKERVDRAEFALDWSAPAAAPARGN